MRRSCMAFLFAVVALVPGCGKDDPVAPVQGPVILTFTFPNATIGGTAETLAVRAGREAGRSVAWAPGIAITLTVVGAQASSLSGTTDADGWFTTTITTAPLSVGAVDAPDTVAITIRANDADSEPVTRSVALPILEPGLQARYSNGVTALEGPIEHGWASECQALGYNRYQGACCAPGACPVDWARATFSATWSGFYDTGEGGAVTFRTYYFVDGVIHIEVDGMVVADLSQSDNNYSTTITLPPHRWVHVTMSFAGDGYGNSMVLGRAVTGFPYWETVPRAELGTPRAWLTSGKGD